MPERDRYSRVADRIVEQRRRVEAKIKAASPVGFAKTRYTPGEIKKQIAKDEQFRTMMLQKLGPGLFFKVAGQEKPNGTSV